MVRAGISLPALQQLMGHSHIRTTMLYVQLAPQDVWREYARSTLAGVRLAGNLFVPVVQWRLLAGWYDRLISLSFHLASEIRFGIQH